MSKQYVLDSSAVLCVLEAERGAETVAAIMEQAIISAVNLSEVVAKLQERGATLDQIEAGLTDLELKIVSFDKDQAFATGKLRNDTRHRGLSLGDRACLALTASLGAIAVTTDRAWSDLSGIAEVMIVR